jgi:hypothetical protein
MLVAYTAVGFVATLPIRFTQSPHWIKSSIQSTQKSSNVKECNKERLIMDRNFIILYIIL